MEVEPAMKKRLFARTLTAAVAALVAGLPFTAAAQAWPGKPVRLVIPFPAGGATDIIGRVIAQKLGAALGQQVVVDNKPGAGGTIGSDMVAKAPADGYTILMATSSTHSIGPALNPKMPYDAFKDFAPAGTPPDIVARLNRELNTIVEDPEVVAVLARSGAEVVGSTPAQFAKVIRDEHDGW